MGVHRSSVGRWIVECRAKVLEATRARLAERLAIDAREVESMIRLLRSQLDESLTGYLKSP
jgi:hypothetical protein